MIKQYLKKFKTIEELYSLYKNMIDNFYYVSNYSQRKKYHEYKKTRIAKGVIYTSITGTYDKLIEHYHFNPDWDYICFTDNPNILQRDSVWEIRPLEFTRLVHFFKIKMDIYPWNL